MNEESGANFRVFFCLWLFHSQNSQRFIQMTFINSVKNQCTNWNLCGIQSIITNKIHQFFCSRLREIGVKANSHVWKVTFLREFGRLKVLEIFVGPRPHWMLEYQLRIMVTMRYVEWIEIERLRNQNLMNFSHQLKMLLRNFSQNIPGIEHLKCSINLLSIYATLVLFPM